MAVSGNLVSKLGQLRVLKMIRDQSVEGVVKLLKVQEFIIKIIKLPVAYQTFLKWKTIYQ